MSTCDNLPGCGAFKAIGGVTGSALGKGAEIVGGDLIQQVADGVTTAVGKALAALGTLWVRVPTPNLTGSQGRGPGARWCESRRSLG